MATVTRTFKIKDVRTSDIQLKCVKTGLVVFVEKDKTWYSSLMWKKIQELQENEQVKLTLESQNSKNTVWKITAIEDFSKHVRN